MPPKHRRRRAALPVAVTGLVAATSIGLAAPTASALDIAPSSLVAGGPASALASPAAAALDASISSGDASTGAPRPAARVAPQQLVSGVRLKAKPPPWQLPVAGYHLTGRFGQSSGLWSSVHTGLDFAGAEGTPINAIAPGTVTETTYDGAFGNKTVVRLHDGTTLWFCHQSSFVAEPGQRVRAGDLIGYIGSTGNVTGPHLHLEVHPGGGDPVDPEVWLPEHGLHP
jgi:murein DD-endopeptidase MepM/ murein hydrolase activator NlpD